MDKLKYFSPVMLDLGDDEDPEDILQGSQGQGGDAGGNSGSGTKNKFSGE